MAVAHLFSPLGGHIGFYFHQGCNGCLCATSFSGCWVYLEDEVIRMQLLGCTFESWQILSQLPHFKDSFRNPVRVQAPSISVAEDGLEMTSPALNHGAVPIVQALSLAETSHGTCYGTWSQKDPGSLKPQSRITATRSLNVLRSFLLSASYFCCRHPCSCFRSTVFCDEGLWSQLCYNDCQQLQSQFVASLWPEGKKHVSQRRLWAASNSKFRHKLI